MTTKQRTRGPIAWAAALGLVLALVAGQVLALGLGRIEVKSQRDQPLLAEIQVISSDPAELDRLQARLASPDTFARIGLEPPRGIVSDLQFAVALDARGNPVIRVTSRAPVTESLLTFLVEVDWGQGRLVREYSALVDAPSTVSAPAQPVIQAPRAAPTDAIVRPAEVPVATQEIAEPEAIAATPAPAAAPAPVRPAPAAVEASPGEYGPVKAGDTLGVIAGSLVGDGVSREQAIVALFRANPAAFIGGNLNLVRQGAVLRMPSRDEVAGQDMAEARAVLREQVAQWRDTRRPTPQPAAAATDAAPVAAQAPGEGPDASATRAAAAQAPGARLEIVPPSAPGGRQAGVRSGIQAGGEGEMLRQELQQEVLQGREALAARESEVAELKARVADLERLQAQQQQLISLKDSELAAAQDRLAGSNADAGTGTAASAAVDGAAPAQPRQDGGMPWAWIGLGLLAAAVIAWLLARRRPAPAKRPRFVTAAALAVSDSAEAPAEGAAAPVVPEYGAGRGGEGANEASAPVGAPTWHAGGPALPQHAVDAPGAAVAEPAEGGVERLELARAYLDLGDVDTARGLLHEVANGGESAQRAEALRLLDGIA
ncbi:FimV/HubP family polar landmark protein [Luteimonas sp. MC1825]|uniref:type IV pilus assembly protein FimV n=1 Tax=Luteimonas sp. MC1825 TaxID=2761107 RepID=UPI001CC5069D|nr:FimV/HubP family polar landmark protein [Luteimonas sp. MC1825]